MYRRPPRFALPAPAAAHPHSSLHPLHRLTRRTRLLGGELRSSRESECVCVCVVLFAGCGSGVLFRCGC